MKSTLFHRSHTSLFAALLTSPWGRSFFRDPDSTSRAITKTILRNFSFFFFSNRSARYQETKHASMEIVIKYLFFFFLKKNEIVNTRDLFTALENLEHLFDSISFLFDTRFFLFEILWIISIEEKKKPSKFE